MIVLGLRLRDIGSERLTYGDVYTILHNSPRSSALFRALHGDAAEWDLPALLLAEVADAARVANWQRGQGRKSDYPKPIPRPGVTDRTQTYGKDALPLDEMAAWLGWDKERPNGD